MLFLVPAHREGEVGDDLPSPGETLIPDIPMGGSHNRFISLETGKTCMHARVEDRRFGIRELDPLADGFCKRFPGLPRELLETLIIDSIGLPAIIGKYNGIYRVLVTDTDATLIGVEDDSVMHQLWAGFDPSRYMGM
jgi:hypothetical protein